MKNKYIGKLGEDRAEIFLKQKGYNIITRNFSCFYGEVDIIAQNKNEIIFVEVKTRTSLKFGYPIDSVSKHKRIHMKKTAEYFLYKNNILENIVRFDVIEVYIINKRSYIKHIKNII